jgi:hypothetical protein
MNELVDVPSTVARAPVSDTVALVPPFPVTIFIDRRPKAGGWAAMPFDQHDLDFPDPDDPEQLADFWADLEGEPVGYGATPDAAFRALQEVLQRIGGYAAVVSPIKGQLEDAWGR